MGRVKMEDDVKQAIIKIAQNNPGAISVMTLMLDHGHNVDPGYMLQGLGYVLLLDDAEIYGPQIWILYKDICGQSITRTLGVMRAATLGFVSWPTVKAAIDVIEHPDRTRTKPLDVDLLLVAVRTQIPTFNKEDSP